MDARLKLPEVGFRHSITISSPSDFLKRVARTLGMPNLTLLCEMDGGTTPESIQIGRFRVTFSSTVSVFDPDFLLVPTTAAAIPAAGIFSGKSYSIALDRGAVSIVG